MTEPRFHHMSELERARILTLHRGGQRPAAIAKETGFSVSSVCEFLVENSDYQAREQLRLTPDLRSKISAMYAAGKSCTDIGNEIGRDAERARQILEKLGVARRSFIEAAALQKKYHLWEQAFDTLTSDSAYWIGFLMGDGNIDPADHAVRIKLAEKDAEHLYAFRTYVKSLHPIKHYVRAPAKEKRARDASTYRYVEMRFCSTYMAGVLATWGVVPKKSMTATALQGIDNSADFWRGVADADGSLGFWQRSPTVNGKRYHYVSPCFTLLGSRPLMQQFASWLARTLQIDKVPWKRGNIHVVDFTGKKAVTVVHALYHNAGTALARKAALARAFDAAGPQCRACTSADVLKEFGS